MIPLRLVRMESNARTIATVLGAIFSAYFTALLFPVTPLLAPLIAQAVLDSSNRGRAWTGHLPISAHTQWLSRFVVTVPAVVAVTAAAVLGARNSIFRARDTAHPVLFGATGLSTAILLLLLYRASSSPKARAPFAGLLSLALAAAGIMAARADLATVVSICPHWLYWSAGAAIMAWWWIDPREPAGFLEEPQYREPPPSGSHIELIFFAAVMVLLSAVTGLHLSLIGAFWAASFGAEFVFSTSKMAHLPLDPRRAFARKALPVVAIMAAACSVLPVAGFSVSRFFLESAFFNAATIRLHGDARDRIYPLPVYLDLESTGPHSAASNLAETAEFLTKHRGYRGGAEELRRAITEEAQFGVVMRRYFDVAKFARLYPDLWRRHLTNLALSTFCTLITLWSLCCIHRARGSRPPLSWLLTGALGFFGIAAIFPSTGWMKVVIVVLSPSHLSLPWDLGPTVALAIAAASAAAYLIAQEAFVRSLR